MSTEELFPIPKYNGYYITKTGRVWREPVRGSGGHNGIWTKIHISNGYPSTKIFSEEKRIHKLLAITFLENKENKPHINHIDGNKQNNSLANLEWCTQKENNNHAFINNLRKMPSGESHYRCKLKKENVIDIYNLLINKETLVSIARKYNVSVRNVKSIRDGNSWKALCAEKILEARK